MVRASTPLKTRNSPSRGHRKVNSTKNSLFRQVFRPTHSPPNVDRQQHSPFKHRTVRNSPLKRPVLAPKSKLQTIREESPDEIDKDEKRVNYRSVRDESANSSFYREFSVDEISDGEGKEDSDGSDYEGWDDETTLVAKFQENAPEVSSREKIAELAYELEGPMQVRADQLKRYLAHTMAPATRKVKEVHGALEQKADVAFGVGVLSFDDSCKKIEQLSLRDEEDIKQVYMETQRNVTEYFKQLKDAYLKRSQLWDQLRDAVEKSASKSLALLSAFPSEIDDVVATVEKKAKEVTKPGAKDNKAKLLRDLLTEM